MQKFLEYMSEPQNIMWIIIVIILIISKFGIGLNYISVNEIVKNNINGF